MSRITVEDCLKKVSNRFAISHACIEAHEAAFQRRKAAHRL